jgi:hypothetical protein
LREEAENAFLFADKDLANPGDALIYTLLTEIPTRPDDEAEAKAAERFVRMLEEQDRLTRCKGALGIGRLCAKHRQLQPDTSIAFTGCLWKALPLIESLVFDSQIQEQSAGAYALREIPLNRDEPTREPDLLDRLAWLWRKSSNQTMRDLGAGALTNQPIGSRDPAWNFASLSSAETDEVFRALPQLSDYTDKPAALVVAWYTRALSDSKLGAHARNCAKNLVEHRFMRNGLRVCNAILKQLGEKPELKETAHEKVPTGRG